MIASGVVRRHNKTDECNRGDEREPWKLSVNNVPEEFEFHQGLKRLRKKSRSRFPAG
jgi:hypothetical protein